MIYTNFNIFKNKFKKNDNQPDYKISSKDPEGKFLEIGACWIKKSTAGDTFLSCKLTENPLPPLTDEEKATIKALKEGAEANANKDFAGF